MLFLQQEKALFIHAPQLKACRGKHTPATVTAHCKGLNGELAFLQDAADLLPLVSGLSVMTYDYSLPNSPGPNAPAAWVRSNAEALAEMAAK